MQYAKMVDLDRNQLHRGQRLRTMRLMQYRVCIMNISTVYSITIHQSNLGEERTLTTKLFKLHHGNMYIGLLMIILQWHNKCLWPNFR